MNTKDIPVTYEFLFEWLIIFSLGMVFGVIGNVWKNERSKSQKGKKIKKSLRNETYTSMVLGGTAALFLYTFSQLLENSSPYLGIVSAIAGGMFYPKILPKLEKALLEYMKSLLPGKNEEPKEKSLHAKN